MCHLDDIFQFLFWYRCVFMSVLCVLEITLFGETITTLCLSLLDQLPLSANKYGEHIENSPIYKSIISANDH